MVGDGPGGVVRAARHPNVRLLEAFYQAQAAFYAGGDHIADLRGLLADDIAWHVPGRSPIAGHYHGHQEVLGYFGARRAHAKATFRVLPRAILADDQQAVHLAGGQLERDGQLRTWQAVGLFRIAGGKDRRVLAGAVRPVPVPRALVLKPHSGGTLAVAVDRAALAALRQVPPATSHVGCVK